MKLEVYFGTGILQEAKKKSHSRRFVYSYGGKQMGQIKPRFVNINLLTSCSGSRWFKSGY